MRARPLFLLVLVSSLAMLIAVRSPEAVRAEDPVTFGAPVRMPMSGHVLLSGASEPSIATGEDGTIYVTAACCLPVSAPAWHSKDGGKTFQVMRSPGGVRESTLGAEGDFVVDDAGRPILTDTRVASIVMSRWRDGGSTWERSNEATEITAPLQDRPWLGWGGGALYLYVNGGQQNTYVYESFDGGVTWNPVAVGSFTGNFPTNLAVDRQDGTIWLVGRNGFTSPSISSHVSTDGGRTWLHRPVAMASRGAVSPTTGLAVAVDEAGNGYAAWSTFNATGCDIEMAVSTDRGQSWQGPYRVNRDPGCSTFAWIDAGLPGRAVITWYRSPQGVDQSRQSASSKWRLHAAVTTDALSGAPTFHEAELGTHVIDQGTLTTGYGQNGGATRSLLDFFEVAAGPDGRFHIAYARNDGTDGTDETWYVGQASGPLLRANRLAQETTVAIDEVATDGGLTVRGSSSFRRAPETSLFPRGSLTEPGATVRPVGPDSDDVLATISIPPTGTPAYDNLAGSYTWAFEVGGEPHTIALASTPAGNRFTLDGARIGGTVDLHDGEAIVRLPLDLVGAGRGDTVRFRRPSFAGSAATGTADYAVPEATVTLSLRSGGAEVASAQAELDQVVASWEGTLDVDGLSGEHELVATACYAGACSSSTRAIEL